MRVSVKTAMFATMLVVPLVLSGCGFDKGSSGSVKPGPDKKVDYVKGDKSKKADEQDKKASEADAKKGERSATLYLLDANGRISPQVVQLPQTKSVAKQSLKYLIKDGPVSDILPNGFQAVIPSGTTIHGVNLDNGTLVANFSKDFLDYKADQEKDILEAITWTLTQFDNIKRVQIQIDGKNKKVMPVGKTPIGKGLSRSDGINTELGNVVDVAASDNITVYYLSEHDDISYYVPVTTRVNSNKNNVAQAVNALLNGPSGKGLSSPFGTGVALKDDPVVKDGVVTLNFNKALLTNEKDKTISSEAINCLALTLTGQNNIKKVAIEVDGSTKVMKETGEPLTEPVSRPTVNKTGV
ncbi:germination protein M [Scopulibacillus darangshiensis]|uniref:Germination protein M n=1 Tax=Scopulibacillus darangshiensis TaxID=442528 RepID=A0A4R2PCP2_9BACL|nr:GerMN domain-containing protein [Scopulibacillus darangshiensis]TCP32144.1 germination protein M [Scopulibacillus darangshiensis]